MAYKHTFNRDYNYLAHFNKNHDPKDGRFTYGDGDGDGILDDHAQRKNFKEFKKSVGRGSIHIKSNGDAYGYELSDDYKKRRQDFINKAKKSATSDDVDNLDIDGEIDRQFGKYADRPIWGLPTGNNARSFIKNWETANIKDAVNQKLLKDNGYEKDGGDSFVWYKKTVKGADIIIDSADEIKYGNAVAKSIEKNKSRLDREKDRILTEERGFPELDRKQRDKFKLQSVSVYGDSETAEANYWYDGPGDPIGGHEINIEFNIKTGKPINYSVNG